VTERGLRLTTGAATLAHFRALCAQAFAEIEEVIPADGSLLLVLRRGAGVSDGLRAFLAGAAAAAPAAAPSGAGTLHTIEVRYGGATGPDLAALARQTGMDSAAYARCHAAAAYEVGFLGFQPGFPYLHGLPPELRAPRRQTPRVRVAAGSVAVGGRYCGIYPADGPGGWHVIGRTAAVLFDPQRAAPALLQPGDRVRFVAA
jgi:allophanate hydrolase subunit 1